MYGLWYKMMVKNMEQDPGYKQSMNKNFSSEFLARQNHFKEAYALVNVLIHQ